MSRIFKELLDKRGFGDDFLNPRYEDLPSPWLMPDMRKAIERIKEGIKKDEKIIVYGDYDADGVTASIVVTEALKLAGAQGVEVMLPDRFTDGYGMNKKVVQFAKERGAGLVITVDCGSGNAEIVEVLKKEGVDTIVTDHHECPLVLPEAVAVVNQKRKDLEDKKEIESLRDLAGVGVAFMVAKAMMEEGMIPKGQEKWLLDTVLVGTICDSMRMSQANRILCFYGRKVLDKTRRIGFRELMRVAGTKNTTSEAIGFQIGPRLNAAGRMANAGIALDLLRATDRTEGARLAMELNRLNEERRTQQQAAIREFNEEEVAQDDVLVVVGNWHEGILGIIAGKLVEEYKKPAFVLTKTQDGVLKGSGRSFGDFNLASALKACGGVIMGGGGHAGAAGVKVSEEHFMDFKRALNSYYRSLNLKNQECYFEVKADIETDGLSEFTLDLLSELEQLEPFGVGNEVPIFGLRDVIILNKKMMGREGKHLCLIVRGRDAKTMKLVAFNAPKRWMQFDEGERIDAMINVEGNEWNGLKSIEGRILDLRGC